MIVAEAVRSGAREIRVHKVRSLLSFSAISVGTASLLYTLAQTRGMQEWAQKNIELMGAGALAIRSEPADKPLGLSKGLNLDDAVAIRAAMPDLPMVSPTVSVEVNDFRAGDRRAEWVHVLGVTPDWTRRDWVYRRRGRFISAEDVRTAARVCVVVEPAGWIKKPFWRKFWTWKSPFEDIGIHVDLLNRIVSMDGHPFRVVGVLRPPARDLDPRWGHENLEVIVPASVFGRSLTSSEDPTPGRISTIKVDAGPETAVRATQRRLETLVLQRHRGERDFKIESERIEIDAYMKSQAETIAVAIALGIVALLSGGIGILNVTLAAVYSRVKEIGIRRALGAERGDVLALFLAEAALLGVAGGVAGVGLGLFGIERIARAADMDVAEVAWYHGVALVALAGAVATAFAGYPAWRAAQLDPVDALREET